MLSISIMTEIDFILSFLGSVLANIVTNSCANQKYSDSKNANQEQRNITNSDNWRFTLNSNKSILDCNLSLVPSSEESDEQNAFSTIISELAKEKEKELLQFGEAKLENLIWYKNSLYNPAAYLDLCEFIKIKITEVYRSCDFKLKGITNIFRKYLIVVEPESYSDIGKPSEFASQIFLITVNDKHEIVKIEPDLLDWFSDKTELSLKDDLVSLYEKVSIHAKEDSKEYYLKTIAKSLELTTPQNIFAQNLGRLYVESGKKIEEITFETNISLWRFLTILAGLDKPQENEVKKLANFFKVLPDVFFN